MLINLSNHPSEKWSKEQTDVANNLFGEIVDMPFPAVDAAGDEEYITVLTDEYVAKVKTLTAGCNAATVHVMGEMTLTFSLVSMLQAKGFNCVASTTERETVEIEPGTKKSVFKFVRFRNYPQI